MQGWGKHKIPEKTRQSEASYGTILGVAALGIEPGSPWWQASSLTTTSLRPLLNTGYLSLLNTEKSTYGILKVVRELIASQDGPLTPTRKSGLCKTPNFRTWESCWTMPLVGSFCRVSPVYRPFAFRHTCDSAVYPLGLMSNNYDNGTKWREFLSRTKRVPAHSSIPKDEGRISLASSSRRDARKPESVFNEAEWGDLAGSNIYVLRDDEGEVR
ncbi:hypothetical protein PR048_017800 [Dryococelus australis]|uniref:Uncharacterized protein n=1 Tax=Dryococelus australis TaxID=614101 RepID=A0ABQ9HAL5_9NEOP|nr:hypothetical protein PR048_017800 [Dryococelus australis]